MATDKLNGTFTALIFFLMVFAACAGDSHGRQNPEKGGMASGKLPEAETGSLADSTKLITELYHNKSVVPSEDYSGFSYSHDFRERDNIIQMASANDIAGHRVEYFIVLKDTAGLYSESSFSEYDNSYEYRESYIMVDRKKAALSEQDLLNLEGEKPAPSLIWYGNDFGISCKYYEIGGREFFLVRGLDLYCNGRQCTSYQVFVIQKSKDEIKASTFYFAGLYPYDFENTFLFDQDGDGNPEMFVPKDVDELNGTSDFDIYELEFSRAVKME